MHEEENPELTDEIPVLFTDEVELLEDRLADIIVAMGLPEGQTAAVLRLVSDALEEHHLTLLDTFEEIIADEDEDKVQTVNE